MGLRVAEPSGESSLRTRQLHQRSRRAINFLIAIIHHCELLASRALFPFHYQYTAWIVQHRQTAQRPTFIGHQGGPAWGLLPNTLVPFRAPARSA